MVRVGVPGEGGVDYVWDMHREDFESFGAQLGISIVTNTTNGVMGASEPRPPQAIREIAGTGPSGIRSQQAFYDRSAGLPDGWRSGDPGVLAGT